MNLYEVFRVDFILQFISTSNKSLN
jgi:hypothetical protein